MLRGPGPQGPGEASRHGTCSCALPPLAPPARTPGVPPDLARVGRGRRRHPPFPQARAPPPRSGGDRSPEGAARREGPRRVPAHLLGAAATPRRGPPPTSSRTRCAPPGRRPTQLFSYPNQKGSETGCGQVLALLGRPEEIRGLTTGARFDNSRPSPARAPGSRETWVYRDRPGRGVHVHPGRAPDRLRLRVPLRGGRHPRPGPAACRRGERDPARDRVPRGPDGHLVPLRDSRARRRGALDLLASPRSDFPLAAETKLVLRGPKGEALVAGLARFPPPRGGAAPGGLARGPGRRRERADRGERGAGAASWPPPATARSSRPGACR